jgi:hypothetical protein
LNAKGSPSKKGAPAKRALSVDTGAAVALTLPEQVAAMYDHTGVQAVVYASSAAEDDFMETATTLLV